MNKRLFIRLLLFFLLINYLFTSISYADMGPKPTITIKLSNGLNDLGTDDYIIDLFVPGNNSSNNNEEIDFQEVAKSRRYNSKTSRNAL